MGKSKEQSQTTERDPWAPAVPALQAGLSQLGGILNNPLKQWEGSVVAPFAPETNTAMDMISQRAMLGNSGMRAGQNLINDTLGGKYLNSNPYRDAMIAGAVRPAVQNYTQNVLPSMSGSAVRSGRYGSDVYGQQMANANRSFADSMADLTGKLSYTDYANERANQNNMLQLAPEYAKADYSDAAMMGQVGAMRQQQQERQAAEQRANFLGAQDEPYQRLSRYFQLLNPVAGLGGSATTTQQTQSDPFQQILGAGLAGAGIFGNLMAPGAGTAAGAASKLIW
jgi:hypothetical protein